jgi:hypothetical protein
MKILSKRSYWFKIRNKDGQVVPFKLNKAQIRLLEKIQHDIKEKGKTRLIIVKGRQLGISTLIENLLLSYAMSVEAFTGYAMAHDATTANDLFDKVVRFAWNNIDDSLKQLYKVKKDNTRQLMFEGSMNQSSVTVGLSGRGNTIDFLHVSEAGKISMNDKLWQEMITGTFPASEKAIGIVIESTADGGLGRFYNMVQQSLKGKNDFEVIFLPWYEAEEYRENPKGDWKEDYKKLSTMYNLYKDPSEMFNLDDEQWYWYYKQATLLEEEVKVQYPFNIEEAFISKSRNKFDVNVVKNIVPLAPIMDIEGVKVYRKIQPGMVYSLGVDVAKGGINAGDFSAFTMRQYYKDSEGKRPVTAQFQGRLEPDNFANIIVNFANWCKQQGARVYIVPEVNYEGDSIIKNILKYYDPNYIYKRYVQDPTKQYDSLIPDYGWITTSKNRTRMIDEFASEWRKGVLPIETDVEKEQALTFVFVPNRDNPIKGRYDHMPDCYDDVLISDFICNQGFDFIEQYG